MIRKHTVIGAAGAGILAVVATVGPAVAAGEETADVSYTCVTAAGNGSPGRTARTVTSTTFGDTCTGD